LRCGRPCSCWICAGWLGTNGERFTAPSGEERAADAAENSYAVSEQHSRGGAGARAISVMRPAVFRCASYLCRTGSTPAPPSLSPSCAHRLHQRHVHALASRSVFIDADRYVSEDSLGYWLAHELGHLATNSVQENDAEKAAREYRKRLRRRAKNAEGHGQKKFRAPYGVRSWFPSNRRRLAVGFFCLGLASALGARSQSLA